MRSRIALIVFLLTPYCLLLTASADSTATGGSTTQVTCNSTTVPVQLVPQTDNGVWVANHPSSAVWIWVIEADSAGRITTGAGVPIAPGNANLFSAESGWHGALWCLTVTTGTADARVGRR